jgi:FAD synthetase
VKFRRKVGGSMTQLLFQVLKEALAKYGLEGIFLSFNGGKDCTVLLHMLKEVLGTSISKLKIIYLRSSDPFQEIEDFVEDCASFYGIEVTTEESDRGMKEVLTEICKKDSEIKAAVMGSRRTDPYCDKLTSFQVGLKGVSRSRERENQSGRDSLKSDPSLAS